MAAFVYNTGRRTLLSRWELTFQLSEAKLSLPPRILSER